MTASLSDAFRDSLAAAAVREGLVDALFTRVSTPIGRLLVVQGAQGIVRVAFEEDEQDRVLAQVAAGVGPRILACDRELAATRDVLEAYFEGEADPLAVAVDLRLASAPFRRVVLETLRRDVARGATISYGALAARSGHPRAARAVGSACARNPIPIFVPCHRVVPSSGGVGSYGGGVARKLALLELEGALPRRLRSSR